MKFKKIFNIVLFLFLFLVPLVPIKEKFMMFPLSADFLIGGVLILIGFITIISMYLNGEKIFKPLSSKSIKVLFVFIVIYGLISAVSVLYSLNKGAAISETVRFAEYVFMFGLIIIICDDLAIEKGIKIFYVAMILASIYGVVQYIFKIDTAQFTNGGFFGRGRAFATFVNPNYWGAAVNMVIFYPVLNIIEKRNIKTNIIIFIVFFFNLFFSSTRGSWLGFVIGIIALGIIKYRKQVLYAMGLCLLMFVIPITRNRFLQIMNIQERLTLWKTGFMMFLENPIKGVGNGNYIYRYERFVKREHRELYQGHSIFSVHNSYIKMLAELGIFGGIAFTFMYLLLFRLTYVVYKNTQKYKRFALAFVGFGASYLFQNFFNNLIFIPQINVFVWVLIAMLYKGLYLEREAISSTI